MLFCQLAQAKSLREICGGLACCRRHYCPKSSPGPRFHTQRVVVWDKEKQRQIVLLTNHLGFGSTTISAIYKDRWQIELFFKALKQNLKVKTFVGTTENALYIQIWTALIAMLLIKYLQFKSKFGMYLLVQPQPP